MRTTTHSTADKIRVLSKNTLTIKDICVLLDCGYIKARRLADKYLEHKKAEVIDTTGFLTYHNFDETRVIKYRSIDIYEK